METFVIGVLVGMAIFHIVTRGEAQRRRADEAKFSTKFSDNQIRFVTQADFRKKNLMNKAEYRVFRVIEDLIKTSNRGVRLFAQTSLGEVIGSDDQKAFECVNSKRVDFLIIDPYGQPLVAIEYQGSGHYRGNAVTRDAVKKEALRRASVAYLEIPDGDDDESIRRKVRDALRWNDVAERAAKVGNG
ncbi:DUF2726 domain-containing protein [Azospirillum soli]|uniref:DUF2726 domain-containing protein n=1 Tax=Azospirillum soli TaxID=1304799 RepID=UPI001AE75139|nr:DUF2726 domain-containing protein [Azospirillum soli]MBP2311240.1 hypothetical protein [Azospirillum soli]